MKNPTYIVIGTVFFVVLFLGLGTNFEPSEQPPKVVIETIFVNVSYDLTNNIGRPLADIHVTSYLPMFAVQNDEVSKSRLSFSSNSTLLAEFNIEKIKPLEKLTFTNNYLIDVSEVVEDSSTASIYEATLTDQKRLEYLQAEWEKNKNENEFIQLNPQSDSLGFLASEISESKKIRVIAGVDKNIASEQKPRCWIQEFTEDKWQTIGPDQIEILPFKVLANGEPISDENCEKALVDAWALNVSNYQITITKKI